MPPGPVAGPTAWLGSELREAPERWRFALSADEVADLERAARRFLALGRDLAEITADAFPLTGFAERAAALRRQLLHVRR